MCRKNSSPLMSLAAAVFVAFAGQPAVSEQADLMTDIVAQAAHKVDVAGRQRMLSQRIAKAACFTARNLAVDDYRAQMAAAKDLFDTSLNALQAGDPEMALTPETSREVLAAHVAVSWSWTDYQETIDVALKPENAESVILSNVNAQSLDLLVAANAAVNRSAFILATKNDAITLPQTVTVDVAGRQRMLSQKMVKELCLMGAPGATEQVRKELAQSAALFETSLGALREGMEEVCVAAPPTKAIEDGLARVAAEWATLKPLVERSLAGEVLDAETLLEADAIAERLLAEMHATVGMYAQAELGL